MGEGPSPKPTPAGAAGGRAVPRRPPGRAPKGKVWDEREGRWVPVGGAAFVPVTLDQLFGARPLVHLDGQAGPAGEQAPGNVVAQGEQKVRSGKFKGRAFEDIRTNERDYILWCRRRKEPRATWMAELLEYVAAADKVLGVRSAAERSPERSLVQNTPGVSAVQSRLPRNKTVRAEPSLAPSRAAADDAPAKPEKVAPEEWWREREAPFPPEFSGKHGGRPRVGQPIKRVDAATAAGSSGGRMLKYSWAGRNLGGEQEFRLWAQSLEQRFPPQFSAAADTGRSASPGKAALRKSHPWESSPDRTKGCREATQACWEAADQHLLRDEWRKRFRTPMPASLGKNFRVDMFGNVIADPENASAMAVCAFEVDHIFPWSRGGRTLRANLAPVQWGANRYKSDKILQGQELGGGGWALLQRGLPVQGFLAIHDYTTVGTKGTDRRSELDDLRNSLTRARGKGFACGDLRQKFGPLLDGQDPVELREAFARWDMEERSLRGKRLPPSPVQGDSSEDNLHSRGPLEKKPEEQPLKEANAPAMKEVLLSLDRRGHAHVQGESTYHLKELLKEMGFWYRKEDRMWTLRLGAGTGTARAAALGRLETALCEGAAKFRVAVKVVQV